MFAQRYTYLLIDFFSVIVPFLFTFHPKIKFQKAWPQVLPAIFLTGLFFIVWDIAFTYWGVWSFNPAYLTGYYLFKLPLEEYLFFFAIPYACYFIYFNLEKFIPINLPKVFLKAFVGIFVLVASVLAFVFIDRLYTSVTLFIAAFTLWIHFRLHGTRFLSHFLVAYTISLLPFFVVNGMLTAKPVVLYNNAENLGIRLTTIPIEDSIYSFILLLGVVTLSIFFSQSQKFNHTIMKIKDFAFMLFSGIMAIGAKTPSEQSVKSIYDLTIQSIDGREIKLSDFKGKKILFVNVASKCGFTPQYKGLQALHEAYKDKLVIIGLPCNQFGSQEPGTEDEIATFCELNYGVTFLITEKIEVKGEGQHPIYAWLTQKSNNGKKDSSVKWNFQKYLVDEQGNYIDFFYSTVDPMDHKITDLLK